MKKTTDAERDAMRALQVANRVAQQARWEAAHAARAEHDASLRERWDAAGTRAALKPCAMDVVFNESGIPDEDRNVVYLMTQRFLNMTSDAGRPSDAMRSTVSSYKQLGRDEFIRRYEQR